MKNQSISMLFIILILIQSSFEIHLKKLNKKTNKKGIFDNFSFSDTINKAKEAYNELTSENQQNQQQNQQNQQENQQNQQENKQQNNNFFGFDI